MAFFHKNLTQERWEGFSLSQQLANIGSETLRAFSLKERGDQKEAQNSLWRALELIDLTLKDEKWRGRRKELLILKEVICDAFFETGYYKVNIRQLSSYFAPFALAAHS